MKRLPVISNFLIYFMKLMQIDNHRAFFPVRVLSKILSAAVLIFMHDKSSIYWIYLFIE